MIVEKKTASFMVPEKEDTILFLKKRINGFISPKMSNVGKFRNTKF